MLDLLAKQLTLTNLAIFCTVAIAQLLFILLWVMLSIYFERKVLGYMQFRIGPNRTGPFGLLQSAADVFKLLIKEDTIPHKAVRQLFVFAPILTFIPSFSIMAVLPYAEGFLYADINVGLLYALALSGISTVGIILAGWASNNKYALIGGMRSAAQMISYEIPLIISVVGVIMMTGSLNMRVIVEGQAGYFWNWNFLPQIIGFIVFVIAAVSELNRVPFDLPEAESELVAGYHVEYSGFRFAFFMLAEYVYVFVFSAIIAIVFLGGWHAPFPQLDFIPGILWFFLKVCCVIFFLFWLRATLPRVRLDQLMGLGWKVLLPLALLNIFVTAGYMSIKSWIIGG